MLAPAQCQNGYISRPHSVVIAWRRYNRAMLRLNLAARCVWSTLVCLALSIAAAAQVVDSALQKAVSSAMAGKRGTAVVVNVQSGRIIAAYHLDVAARRVAAPGSSIKPFTLLALLESGKVNEQTALVCKRSLSIAGHKLDCTHPETAQPLDPPAALAYSCNSYFTTVALRLTPEQLYNSFLRDGFSTASSLVAGEANGEVTVAQSPEQLQLQAIGESGVRVTPLELLEGYRKLAALQPKHEERLEPLFVGLEQSTTYGMGRMAQPSSAMKVAGKTGTTPADDGAGTHAWFAGYSPAGNPKIVLVVFLERGHGGSEAAEIARQIFAAFADSRMQMSKRGSGAQP